MLPADTENVLMGSTKRFEADGRYIVHYFSDFSDFFRHTLLLSQIQKLARLHN